MAEHKNFLDRTRTHVLMITNHGIHEWKVVPGLPDTGGQNVYVNQFTESLIDLGYRVTIVNRGGFPHPVTKRPRTGIHYHHSGHARIMYIEDGKDEFVRKEDMDEQLPTLRDDLRRQLEAEEDTFDVIISHYWDAGKLGMLINEDERTGARVPHIWIPHSLGCIKKRNMHPSTWANLRIDERIGNERKIVDNVDACVATSSTIRQSLMEDYGCEAPYFLPPCIDTDRFHPLPEEDYESIYSFLADHCPLTPEQVRQRKLITEISRTDETKRKDVLIRAYAQVRKEHPEALLAVSIDEKAPELYAKLNELIRDLDLEDEVVVLGSVWEQLPKLYNATAVYCTPSVMEGFGMSAEEAAATRRPVVASNLVPYVCEYLIGKTCSDLMLEFEQNEHKHVVGKGGVVCMADDVQAFATALSKLLSDDELRRRMGDTAYEITIPYFTWEARTKDLLGDLGITPRRAAAA